MNIRHTVFRGVFALAVASLAGSGIAIADQGNTPDGTASDTCFSNHNFSTGNNNMGICFSNHGNLMQFTSPAGFEHIRVGGYYEGYILNDVGAAVNYYDTGGVESGFGAPVISQPNGANTFPLTITRTTTDGNFTLKQVMSWNTGLKEVKFTMTVTNNSATPRLVKLTRYFDGDIDNSFGNYYAKTNNSVMAWNDGAGAHGLVLYSVSLNVSPSTVVNGITGGGPVPAGVATPTAAGDYEGYLTHTMTINAGKSKVVSVAYKRI